MLKSKKGRLFNEMRYQTLILYNLMHVKLDVFYRRQSAFEQSYIQILCTKKDQRYCISDRTQPGAFCSLLVIKTHDLPSMGILTYLHGRCPWIHHGTDSKHPLPPFVFVYEVAKLFSYPLLLYSIPKFLFTRQGKCVASSI